MRCFQLLLFNYLSTFERLDKRAKNKDKRTKNKEHTSIRRGALSVRITKSKDFIWSFVIGHLSFFIGHLSFIKPFFISPQPQCRVRNIENFFAINYIKSIFKLLRIVFSHHIIQRSVIKICFPYFFFR